MPIEVGEGGWENGTFFKCANTTRRETHTKALIRELAFDL